MSPKGEPRRPPSPLNEVTMMRAARLVIISVAGIIANSTALDAVECLDFANYLHWAGAVDTPRLANGVALAGDLACKRAALRSLQINELRRCVVIAGLKSTVIDTSGNRAAATIRSVPCNAIVPCRPLPVD